jgi:hypothetical protein
MDKLPATGQEISDNSESDLMPFLPSNDATGEHNLSVWSGTGYDHSHVNLGALTHELAVGHQPVRTFA